MPGKFRKSPTSRSFNKSLKKFKSHSKSSRRVASRLKTNSVRRSTNLRRVAKRNLKREAARERSLKFQPRPRPVARPRARPQKIMPKRPAPSRIKDRVRRSKNTSVSGTGRRQSISVGVGDSSAVWTLNTANAAPYISDELSSLQTSLNELHSRSSFQSVASDIEDLDKDLNHALNLLESARDKDYRYYSEMEDIAYQAIDRWQSVRGQVEKGLRKQAQMMQNKLTKLDPQIRRLNANLRSSRAASSVLHKTESQVNQLLWDIQKAERTLKENYEDIQAQVLRLNSRLTHIHWALDQLSEAKFKLDHGEDLVMAVPTRWDKEEKDDPEGVLFLTNQRLVFERKEKVATKKVLFITTASELVHKVLIDQKLDEVQGVKAANKGLFGHHDYLEVQFADPNLGEINFHIDGQDSQDWGALVERAKSGAIESDRASGAGVSFRDLTGPLTKADLIAIQSEVNELQDELMLKDVEDELTELENQVRSLERDLADLRARGYAVEKSLEADVSVLSVQWDRIKERAEATLMHQSKILSEQLSLIQSSLSELMSKSDDLSAARPVYIQLKSAIASAEAQADAAEDTVLDQFDEYADEVEGLSAHFEWIDWALDALSTASFRLLAGESIVAAIESIWERTSGEPENGILFLTDQRLLWEDRVDKYELKLDVPLQQISEVEGEMDEQDGLELLKVTFDGPDAPLPLSKFRLTSPVSQEWVKMIGRARSGDYTEDRAIKIDEQELERVRNAPRQCSNCGATFTAPVLRGQTEIVCEYCGVVTRI